MRALFFSLAGLISTAVFSQTPGILPLAPEKSPASGGTQVSFSARFLEKPQPGIPLTLEIVIHNQGNAAIEEIFLHQNWEKAPVLVEADLQPLIQGSRWTWDIQGLQAQKSRIIRAKIIPGTVETLHLRPMLGYKSAAALPQGEDGADSLHIQVDGPEWVRRGERAVFDIHVVNHGNKALEGVTIRDQLPQGLKHPEGTVIEAALGAIPPGKTRTIRLETLAVATGKFSQDIQVVSANGQKKLLRSGISISDAHCKLEWKKIREDHARGELEMALEGLFFAEESQLKSLAIQTHVPEGLEIVSQWPMGRVTPGPGATKAIVWESPQVNPGGKWEARLKFRALKHGDWPLRAEGKMEEAAGANCEFLVRIEGQADLQGEFTQKSLELSVGQETEIRFVLKNPGPVTAQNIRVHLALPEGLFPISWNGPVVGGLEGGVIQFDTIKEIPSLKEETFLLKVRSLRNGNFKVQAEFGQGNSRRASSCEVISPSAP